eukprot:TRINITY_DN1378_c0_g1_i2.p1 TRINITY_DN1378_c0_g1~~TRINITY_DN1378_c0_g1_i2.p1  ORF type:complete len:373 (-),score=68.60 TRINITY_DN1378_c0_g1_i2:218-1336(-)
MRYSLVRQQGFEDTSTSSYKTPERHIIDHQVQQYRIFKQLAIAYAFKFSGQWMSAKQKETKKGDDQQILQELKEIAATGAGLKGLCTYMAWEGIEDCRKCCGGNGYLMVSGIAPLAQDYVWQITAEGDYMVMLLQLARFLLSTYQDAVKGIPVSDQCNYLTHIHDPSFQVSSLLPPRAKHYNEFLNPSYLLLFFKFRALINLKDFASAYVQAINGGASKDDAINSCALSGTHAVRAHCFYFVLRNFISAVANVTDQPVKEVLNQVCTLFGLCIMIDDNWAGCLDHEHIVMAKDACSHILRQLRPNGIGLVDAFDIPDRVLCSAIGNYDGNIYEALYESAKKATLNQVDPYVGYKEVVAPRLDLEVLKSRSKL